MRVRFTGGNYCIRPLIAKPASARTSFLSVASDMTLADSPVNYFFLHGADERDARLYLCAKYLQDP